MGESSWLLTMSAALAPEPHKLVASDANNFDNVGALFMSLLPPGFFEKEGENVSKVDVICNLIGMDPAKVRENMDKVVTVTVDEIFAGLKKCEDGGCPPEFMEEEVKKLVAR